MKKLKKKLRLAVRLSKDFIADAVVVVCYGLTQVTQLQLQKKVKLKADSSKTDEKGGKILPPSINR